MNCLILLDMDVYNIPTYNIMLELIKRGHNVKLYATQMEDLHIWKYKESGMNIRSFTELTQATLDWCDFIYSAQSIPGVEGLIEKKKYIFHYTTTPFDEPGGYGDFTFTQRDMHHTLIRTEPSLEAVKALKATPGQVTGSPKFDHDQFDIKTKKQILFVDASHTPDCVEGKMEEANLLLNIARRYPDYRLIIKTRYFKNDKTVTHRNEVYLIDCINAACNNRVPCNLVFLDTYADLEELARESELIITPDLTSSYCSAGAYGKGGIIITGMTYKYPRWKRHLKLFREVSARSGLMCQLEDVIDHIPRGKEFDKNNVTEMGLDITCSSARIVDTIEAIFSDFLTKNIFPKVNRDDCKNVWHSFDELISIRYIKSLYVNAEIVKREIENADFTSVDAYVHSLLDNHVLLNRNNYHTYSEEVDCRLCQSIIDGYQEHGGDIIAQEHYIKCMFKNGKFYEIKEDEFEAKEMFEYYAARYLILNKEYRAALGYLEDIIEKIESSTFEETLAYSPYYLESSLYWAGFCYYELKKNIEAEAFFKKCDGVSSVPHIKARKYLELLRCE